jgi:hypothetical protein
MKYDGRGYRLGSKPSTDLWEIRPKDKYLPKASSQNTLDLGKKLDLSISKISMPRRLPPIKFETQSPTKLKPKYLNKSNFNLHQPIVRRQSPIVKPEILKEVKKVYSPSPKSEKKSTDLKEDFPKKLAVIYESVDTRVPEKSANITIKQSADTLTKNINSVSDQVQSPIKTVADQRTTQVAQKFKQIEDKTYQEPVRNRVQISQMIEKTFNQRSNEIKPINRIIPPSPSIDECNNDKFTPEEITDKTALSSGVKFWRPPDLDTELDDYDPLPKEYVEFSFYLSLPGCERNYLSLEADAPVSNITSFIQRCISSTPESSKRNENVNLFSFSIANDSNTMTDADIGPWNTKLLCDLGIFNSEIRVIPLEEF